MGALEGGGEEGHTALGPLTWFTFLAPHQEQLAGLVTVNRSLLAQVLAVKLGFCESKGANGLAGLQ